MSRNSTAKTAREKPDKPYKGFPLFAHPSGQWAKKIRGRTHYFGVWSSPEAALERLNFEYPYLADGRTPPAVDVSNGCTLKVLCNEFLKSKEQELDANDLALRTFKDYHSTCRGMLEHFGPNRRVDDLQPADFGGFRGKLQKRLGVTSLKTEISRCRVVFNLACQNRLIDTAVRFGAGFQRPSAKSLRRSRNEVGAKLFTQEEAHAILEEAKPVMRAMVLLGLNCAFGNSDLANLPRNAADLETGWIDFPRPKTEVPRRVPLWPDTVAALREALPLRPTPIDSTGRGLCFLTTQGRQWVRMKMGDGGPQSATAVDALCPQFGKLLKRLKINGRRGLGFYTLRRCFETYAGESKSWLWVGTVGIVVCCRRSNLAPVETNLPTQSSSLGRRVGFGG